MDRSGNFFSLKNPQALNLLEHKAILRFAVLIAIINKIFIAYIFTDLEGDKSLYLIMAENFLDTGSMLEPIILPDGRNTETYPIHLLSPLYILLAIPVLAIVDSFELASLVIDALGWILFFTGLARVGSQILRNKTTVVLLILCVGFIVYPHQSTS